MHEYSIIQSLVDSVSAAAGGRGSVHRIVVRIGDLAGVDCGLLRTAYEIFRAGTVCESASMTIERVPARWGCPGCGMDIVRGGLLQCPGCGQPARLVTGDEIVLQRIELEVPDVSGLRMR